MENLYVAIVFAAVLWSTLSVVLVVPIYGLGVTMMKRDNAHRGYWYIVSILLLVMSAATGALAELVLKSASKANIPQASLSPQWVTTMAMAGTFAFVVLTAVYLIHRMEARRRVAT